jgi:dTDP-4-amino-4,6-dideoxygalactose transaminase
MATLTGNKRRDASPNGKEESSGKVNVIGGTAIYNKRLIAFQERRLLAKLERYDKLVAHQRWVVARYEDLLAQTGYQPLVVDSRFDPVLYKYPLLSDSKKDIFDRARQAGIELSDMFISPLYPDWHKRIWESLGYREGMCPISESVSERIVPLSIHSKIRSKEIERTIALLASFQ